MSNIHPLFREALAPFSLPALRQFSVFFDMCGEGCDKTVNVMAYTCADAITKAVDFVFDGGRSMPMAGIQVTVEPMAINEERTPSMFGNDAEDIGYEMTRQRRIDGGQS